MNSNPTSPKKISTVPLAVLQVVAAVLLALISRAENPYVSAIGVTVIAAAFAVQILVSRSYWYFISMALCLSFSFLIGGVAPLGICICALFAGIMLASMIKKKQTKISVSLALTILYIVFFALVFLAVYLLGGNEFSVSAIFGYFSDKIDAVKDAVLAEESVRELVEMYAQSYEMTAEEYVEVYMTSLKLFVPAAFITFLAILSYITACFFKLFTKISGCEIILPDPKWETLPSLFCAWTYAISYTVYIGSYVVAMLSSGSTGVLYIASYSLVMIFSPVMLLMGAKWIARQPKRGVIIAVFVFGFLFMGSIAVNILAFFGVHETLRRRAFMKKSEQKK